MWLIAEYESVSLFSLKMSSATSSGGKTLLVPTPYALKMALLDNACRMVGIGKAENLWPEIRDLQIAINPAAKVMVTNLFQKVLRPYKNPPPPGIPDFGPFQKTIAYREYAQLLGPMSLGLGWNGEDSKPWLADLLVNINYIGKRGSFIQIIKLPYRVNDLPDGFVKITEEQTSFMVKGVLQMLDDCTPSLTFSKANIYSKEKVKAGEDRIVRHIVIPYLMMRSSKSFTLYERSDMG
jgi:hypothetical protein